MYNAKEIKARTNQLFENRGEKAYKVLPTLGLSKSTLENPSMPKIDTIAVIADYLLIYPKISPYYPIYYPIFCTFVKPL